MITLEKRWQQRANGMTLAEIEAELKALPIAPKTDNEIIGRAELMRRFIELGNARKPDPLAPPPDPAGMIEVIAPDGWSGCIMSRTSRGKYYHATVRDDGRLVIRCPLDDFLGVANATAGQTNINGASWWAANPALADLYLPKRLPPAPPAPYQESRRHP